MTQRKAVSFLLSALAAVWLAALLPVSQAGPAVELNASRGLTFDRQISASEDGFFGTRRILLRGAVSLYSASAPDKAAVHQSTTVFVPCREHLTKSSLNELSTAPINGLLVALCESDNANEALLSLFFASSTVEYPVYFMEEEAGRGSSGDGSEANHVAAVEKLLTEHGSGTGEYVVLTAGKSLRASQPFVNETIPVYQLYSSLVVKAKDPAVKSVPRVLVSANFDTFGVAPSTRTTAGASGAAAAVELYRRESILAAADEHNDDGYGLSVLLGSSARFNYAGTTAWLQGRKDSEMDRFKLVISLDELVPGTTAGEEAKADAEETLYMHVQDTFMRRGDGKATAELAQKIAAAHGVELKVQPARTNYQHYDLRFEHEVFANRQLPAVTFSTYRSPTADQIFRGSVRQALSDKSLAVLAKRVGFLQAFIEALLQLNDGTDASLTSKWIGATSYLAGLITAASRTVRCPVALDGKPLQQYAESLEQLMRQIDTTTRSAAAAGVLVSTSLQPTSVKPSGIIVYGPYEENMKLFVAKSLGVEAAVAVGVVAALVVFGLSEFGLRGLIKVVRGY